MNFEEYDGDKIVTEGLDDPNIQGVYFVDGQPILDRRYTTEAIARLGLSARTADLNIIGPDKIPVPEELIPKIPEPKRGWVKGELLRKGLPGVNL